MTKSSTCVAITSITTYGFLTETEYHKTYRFNSDYTNTALEASVNYDCQRAEQTLTHSTN